MNYNQSSQSAKTTLYRFLKVRRQTRKIDTPRYTVSGMYDSRFSSLQPNVRFHVLDGQLCVRFSSLDVQWTLNKLFPKVILKYLNYKKWSCWLFPVSDQEMSRHANSRVQEGTLEYINIVKKHEEIYNITHPGYKNLESKTMAWKRISEEINLPIGNYFENFRKLWENLGFERILRI